MESDRPKITDFRCVPDSMIQKASHPRDQLARSVPSDEASCYEVRGFLYSILTLEDWDICTNYPDAVSATVNNWYGSGARLRMLHANKDLESICPSQVVSFAARKLIEVCLSTKLGKLILEESPSERFPDQFRRGDEVRSTPTPNERLIRSTANSPGHHTEPHWDQSTPYIRAPPQSGPPATSRDPNIPFSTPSLQGSVPATCSAPSESVGYRNSFYYPFFHGHQHNIKCSSMEDIQPSTRSYEDPTSCHHTPTYLAGNPCLSSPQNYRFPTFSLPGQSPHCVTSYPFPRPQHHSYQSSGYFGFAQTPIFANTSLHRSQESTSKDPPQGSLSRAFTELSVSDSDNWRRCSFNYPQDNQDLCPKRNSRFGFEINREGLAQRSSGILAEPRKRKKRVLEPANWFSRRSSPPLLEPAPRQPARLGNPERPTLNASTESRPHEPSINRSLETRYEDSTASSRLTFLGQNMQESSKPYLKYLRQAIPGSADGIAPVPKFDFQYKGSHRRSSFRKGAKKVLRRIFRDPLQTKKAVPPISMSEPEESQEAQPKIEFVYPTKYNDPVEEQTQPEGRVGSGSSSVYSCRTSEYENVGSGPNMTPLTDMGIVAANKSSPTLGVLHKVSLEPLLASRHDQQQERAKEIKRHRSGFGRGIKRKLGQAFGSMREKAHSV